MGGMLVAVAVVVTAAAVTMRVARLVARVVGGSAFSVMEFGGLRGLAAWHAGWLMVDGPGSTTDECFPLSFSEQANVCHIHRLSHMGRQQCETFVKCRPQMRSTNSARSSASQREWILLAG